MTFTSASTPSKHERYSLFIFLMTVYHPNVSSRSQLNEEASDKVLEVETEYNKKRRPHYEKRSAVLRRIPGFWKEVILSHGALEQFFSRADKEVLDHLVEVSCFSYSFPSLFA